MKNARRALIVLLVLSVTALIITATAQAVSGDVKLVTGILLTLGGLALLPILIAYFSTSQVNYTGIYIILLLSILYILIGSAYLAIDSPEVIISSIINAFNAR